VADAEQIRDELLRINLGLWDYAKNHNPATKEQNANRELVWLNYVPGVRESRRLMGPYVMSQVDFDTRWCTTIRSPLPTGDRICIIPKVSGSRETTVSTCMEAAGPASRTARCTR
jgi:hypothetical protein